MIYELGIENLGIISRAEVEFSPKLTVLTGETGAGKTMVLSSIGLLTGGKADTRLIAAGSDELAVTGVVNANDSVIDLISQAGGVVDEDTAILTRIVRPNRSKAIAGGRTVPAATLSQIGAEVVTVHGQADQWKLRSATAQRELLDRAGGEELAAALASYRETLAQYRAIEARYRKYLAATEARAERIATLEAELAQLQGLDITAGEDEELTQLIERLTNVEDLRADVAAVINGLHSIQDAIDVRRLERARGYDQSLAEDATALTQGLSILNEVNLNLASYLGDLEAQPERLNQAHERLAQIKSACRGRAVDATELVAWIGTAEAELAQLRESEVTGADLAAASEQARGAVTQRAQELTAARARAGQVLSQKVSAELAQLAMTGAEFSVHLAAIPATDHGADEVEFRLAQGHQHQPQPIAATASGGELSRIMLALEVVAASATTAAGPTLIFDEIDAGIGGATALAVGQRLARLARHRQVIVVTHLAQVAAYGTAHLVVRKEGGQARVETVTGQDRVAEIARMLSGKSQSKSALEHAAELLRNEFVE